MVVERVTIRNASERLVACVLADLAGFKGAMLSRATNRYFEGTGTRECAIIFSQDTF